MLAVFDFYWIFVVVAVSVAEARTWVLSTLNFFVVVADPFSKWFTNNAYMAKSSPLFATALTLVSVHACTEVPNKVYAITFFYFADLSCYYFIFLYYTLRNNASDISHSWGCLALVLLFFFIFMISFNFLLTQVNRFPRIFFLLGRPALMWQVITHTFAAPTPTCASYEYAFIYSPFNASMVVVFVLHCYSNWFGVIFKCV